MMFSFWAACGCFILHSHNRVFRCIFVATTIFYSKEYLVIMCLQGIGGQQQRMPLQPLPQSRDLIEVNL